jgi:hypothetical protein
MKNTQFNSIFISNLLIIFFLTAFQSCEKQELNSVTKEQGTSDIFKSGKLQDFNDLNTFVSKEFSNTKSSGYLNRNSTEDTNSFTIINHNITMFIDGNGKTFTLKIVKDDPQENSFSNLIINFDEDNNTNAYIINYFPSEEYILEYKENPQTVFKGNFNYESINYDGDLDFLGNYRRSCVTVSNTYCNWGGTTHSAGENCTAAYIFNVNQTVCWDTESFENPDSSTNNTSPNTGSGSGSGGGASGGGSTNPNPLTECDVVSAFGENGIVDGSDCDDDSVNELIIASIVVFSPDNPIVDISDFLECFDVTQSATLTVYVDEPNPGTGDVWSATWNGAVVGHTFISISQGNNDSVFGYYPADEDVIPSNPTGNSALGNDSNGGFSASISTTVSGNQLAQIINLAINSNLIYNLNTYNCTDFGIDAGNLGGMNLPPSNGTWFGGGGSNPGTLGTHIRGVTPNATITTDTAGGNAPTTQKGC